MLSPIWFCIGLMLLPAFPSSGQDVINSGNWPGVRFTVSFPQPGSKGYHVEMHISGLEEDTVILHMPKWMPGYYQIMDYARNVTAISAVDDDGKQVPADRVDDTTWQLIHPGDGPLVVRYDIQTRRKFVAASYVDSSMAYILPAASFLYMKEFMDIPVRVIIEPYTEWTHVATGLEPVPGAAFTYFAPDYDILYDCPLLTGNLEELPPFEVDGIRHRFIGYQLGDFDGNRLMADLKTIVESATAMFGDIPYEQYTFIGIGPGRGGIEHLNNTTVSFDGSALTGRESYIGMLAFLAHEYFHHYNVKRIRPIELGPFQYDRENRTNQLWISEGLTVYYEYLLLRRSGLIDEPELLAFLAGDLTAHENDQGKEHQSLQQASYSTWEDGPFGMRGGEADRSISIYEKGAIVGMMLDFRIRNATGNQRSLDDVMRVLYREYYQERGRGFSGAEFRQACEQVAGTPLTELFEYVVTTTQPDYQKYLDMAGLQLIRSDSGDGDTDPEVTFAISRVKDPDQLQLDILQSWQSD